MHAWTTPYSQERRLKDSNPYPKEVYEAAELIWCKGLVDPTKSNYGAGVLRFNQYCDKRRIPERLCMPVSDILLSGFIGEHAGKVSGDTIKAWLSGIHMWHILHGAPWCCNDSPRVTLARRAAKVEGSGKRRPQRAPITIEHMQKLHDSLDFSIPFHCTIWALAFITFWGCRRLGELTIPSAAKFNPKFHAIRGTTFFAPFQGGNFHIPWTKTTKEVGADVSFTGRDDNPSTPSSSTRNAMPKSRTAFPCLLSWMIKAFRNIW
jgi:hypothetical protein